MSLLSLYQQIHFIYRETITFCLCIQQKVMKNVAVLHERTIEEKLIYIW